MKTAESPTVPIEILRQTQELLAKRDAEIRVLAVQLQTAERRISEVERERDAARYADGTDK